MQYWEVIADKLSAADWTWGYCSAVTHFGVTINSNVPLTFGDIGTGSLTAGTVFIVIGS